MLRPCRRARRFSLAATSSSRFRTTNCASSASAAMISRYHQDPSSAQHESTIQCEQILIAIFAEGLGELSTRCCRRLDTHGIHGEHLQSLRGENISIIARPQSVDVL